MNNNLIYSINFYNLWIKTVNSRKNELLDKWRSNKEYTNLIKGHDDSIISKIAENLNLLCYPHDYYSIDAIMYLPEDLTPGINNNTFWLRDIRVAFEHENNFRGGLYQEVSHLLITSCDLRVLVTYPNDDTANELEYLHKIISGNRNAEKISNDESFLIIFGYENDFSWEGYVFKTNAWKKI